VIQRKVLMTVRAVGARRFNLDTTSRKTAFEEKEKEKREKRESEREKLEREAV
jgi:hypothetical protein